MTQEDYRRAFDAATREYEELGAKRHAIDKRLAELAQTIGTLSKLIGLTPTVPLGLTDAVRMIMRAGVPMTPVEVRDRLHAIGFDMEKYANDLAAVHTILKRLNESGELRFVPRTPGKHQYTLNRPSTAVALGPDILRYMRENAAERDAMHATDDDPTPPKRAARRGSGERRPR
jgi:hypothetical protein